MIPEKNTCISENLLYEISKSFLQMKKIIDFPWEVIVSWIKNKQTDQRSIAEATFRHPILKSYTPKAEYVKGFLKKLIHELEVNDVEVDEIIYDKYIFLINQTFDDEAFFYRTYVINEDLQISLKETNKIIGEGTTGLTTWQASHVLIEYLLERPLFLRSKRVLELGSGLGLTGIAVIKKCDPQSFTFSDHHPKVLEFLKCNIANNLHSKDTKENPDNIVTHWGRTDIFTKCIDWESTSDIENFDLVIGADILFDIKLFGPLIKVLRKCLREPGSKAVFATTVRNENTLKAFCSEIGSGSDLKIETNEEITYQGSASEMKAQVNILTISALLANG